MKAVPRMPILRLAYVALFLVAVIAVFTLWSQVGGQDRLDVLPWHVKMALGVGGAYATVKATQASLAGKTAWSLRTLRWLSLLAAIAAGCALATWYAQTYLEEEETAPEEEPATAGRFSSARMPVSMERVAPASNCHPAWIAMAVPPAGIRTRMRAWTGQEPFPPMRTPAVSPWDDVPY